MNACYYLSGLYISGTQDKIIDKDMKLAFKYSEKACELGKKLKKKKKRIFNKKNFKSFFF